MFRNKNYTSSYCGPSNPLQTFHVHARWPNTIVMGSKCISLLKKLLYELKYLNISSKFVSPVILRETKQNKTFFPPCIFLLLKLTCSRYDPGSLEHYSRPFLRSEGGGVTCFTPGYNEVINITEHKKKKYSPLQTFPEIDRAGKKLLFWDICPI